jgi:hypothetical protein
MSPIPDSVRKAIPKELLDLVLSLGWDLKEAGPSFSPTAAFFFSDEGRENRPHLTLPGDEFPKERYRYYRGDLNALRMSNDPSEIYDAIVGDFRR